MLSIIFPAIIANLTATGSALLLARRGSTRRLKLLALTVGLMSLSQTASLLHAQGWAASDLQAAQMHQTLAGCLSLLSIYLLGREMYDRAIVERKLRLIEHEVSTPQQTTVQQTKQNIEGALPLPLPQMPSCVQSNMQLAGTSLPTTNSRGSDAKTPVDQREPHPTAVAMTIDLMRLLSHVSDEASIQSSATTAVKGGESFDRMQVSRG